MNMETDKKGSKVATISAVLAVLVIIFFGWSLYRSFTNTPDRTVQAYINDLAANDMHAVEGRSSDVLKKDEKSIIWRYEAMLKGYNDTPQLVGKEEITDRFNTYPKNSQPLKLTYKVTINGKDHLLSFLVFKQGKVWKVDDITGS